MKPRNWSYSEMGLRSAISAHPDIVLGTTERFAVGLPAAFFAVTVLLQIFAWSMTLNLYDEGIILVGAQRVFNGEIPYRDFWSMYGPAPFFLSSWMGGSDGPTVIGTRSIGIIAKAITVALVMHIALPWTGVLRGSLLATVVAFILVSLQQDAFPVFPALALTFACAATITRQFGRPTSASWHLLLAAGLLTGTTALFRHDLAAYLFVATAMTLVIDKRGAGVLPALCFFGTGVAFAAGPVVAWLLHEVPLNLLHESLLSIPSKVYPEVRALPFPGLQELKGLSLSRPRGLVLFGVYIPLLALPYLALWLFHHRHSLAGLHPEKHATRTRYLLVVFLTAIGALFILKGWVRTSNIHMFQSQIPVLCAVSIALLGKAPPSAGFLRWGVLVGVAAAGVLAILMAATGLQLIADGLAEKWRTPGDFYATCSKAGPMRCSRLDGKYQQVAHFVEDNSRPNDRIYVGVPNHDKVFINPLTLYFATARRPVTRWHEVHPGVHTTQAVQEEIIREMSDTPPSLVVLDGSWDNMNEPNDSARSTGVKALDRFIRLNYMPAFAFEKVVVLRLRGAIAKEGSGE